MSNIEEEANKIWEDFKESVLYNNRFFIKHPLLNIIKLYIENNVYKVENGTIFYRARIIDDNSSKDHMLYKCLSEDGDPKKYFGKNQFRGLSKEASYVPVDNKQIGDGRANPRFIKYLYMAEEPVTAIFEVRPLLIDAVNLAEIETQEELNLANIAVELDRDKKRRSVAEYIMSYIQGSFSYPTNNKDHYIPTQIIAEYIKSIGYDGIRYNSSLHKGGVNLTVFNYEKCHPISSRDFRIEDMKITARAAIGSDSGINKFGWIVDNKVRPLGK